MKGMIKKKTAVRDSMPATVKVVALVVTTLLSIACVVPFLLCVSASFTDEATLSAYGYKLIPMKFSTAAYQYFFQAGAQVWRAYGVTIVVTVSGVFLGLAAMSMYAYAITRPSFPWKNGFSFFSYFTMLFNGGMVSSYIFNTNFYHLRDSIWILILSGCIGAYNILLMRTYMKSSIPAEIFESAKMDGAGEFQCFWQFALPLAKPMLATIGLFLMVSYWNNWNTGFLYLVKRNDLAPIQLVLKRIENMNEYLAAAETQMSQANLDAQLAALPTESFKMALVVVVALPMIIAYPFFKKFLVNGITVGAVKG